ncbi:glycosyltransferase [Micromonospora sp. NPDC018662]|uniref:glycosyltransferase n=1 Tax=Micromonospora sp. NPDC018662 TaxID=3364238 RepID=UPI0037929EF6
MTKVNCLIINHNTSALAAVALASVVLSTDSWSRDDLAITVMDNSSTDPDVALVAEMAKRCDVPFLPSRWPHPGPVIAAKRLDSTGDGLRDFVVQHQDCDYYWLVDSDVEVPAPGVLDALVAAMEQDRNLWAATATMARSDDADLWAQIAFGDIIEMAFERSRGGRNGPSRKEFQGPLHVRSPHACTLVRRDDVVVSVARHVGMSPVGVMSGDPAVGGFYDTFGMFTRVMTALGRTYTTVDVPVLHAEGGSWAAHAYPERAERARVRAAELARELESRGHGAPDAGRVR